MACTTVLVGKNASYDGSTMIARNDDNPTGTFSVKKVQICERNKMSKVYKSKISHVEIPLPDNSYRFSYTPSVKGDSGIWGASGINEYNVSMTATETITANYLVLATDPYVIYDKKTNTAGGIGEEDILMLVLPYIKNAREGVLRLGKLLENYGTYEPNGIAFADENEVWYLETIGGHHYIARRLKDDEIAILPNQLSIDYFDFDKASIDDALTNKDKEFIASNDILNFIKMLHIRDIKNPKIMFGTHSDSDHEYNTARAWIGYRCLNCKFSTTSSRSNQTAIYDGENANIKPTSDDIPFSMIPSHKLTIEDVKYILSNHYQGTIYDPYYKYKEEQRLLFRPIGISRTAFMSVLQIRGYIQNDKIKSINWLSFSCNVFNTLLPFYTNVDSLPKYISNTSEKVDTNYFYWQSRIISALVDAHFNTGIMIIERYQNKTLASSLYLINKYDKLYIKTNDDNVIKEANDKISDMVHAETDSCLDKVLYNASMHMKNGFSRNDN
mgnify:FL=1